MPIKGKDAAGKAIDLAKKKQLFGKMPFYHNLNYILSSWLHDKLKLLI